MAKVVVVEIKSKGADKVAKDMGKIGDEVDGINKSAEELQDNLGSGLQKAGEKGKKGLKSVATGFKGIGTAIKAAGIGIVIGLFAALKAILEEQQPVLDLVDTTMTAIGLTIRAVSDALSTAWENASQATGGFDAMQKVVSNLLTIALAPLKAQFFAIKGAVLGAQLAWEKSFLGDGDPETIARLEKGLSEVKDDLIEIGEGVIDAGVAIAENIGEAIDEVVTFAGAATTELEKINAQAIINEAQRTTELKNQAAIREAINQGLLESFDRQAEQQRQIRDDETKSFEERIVANEKLGAILEEQELLMIANAKQVTASAQAQVNANNTIENQVALIQAQNEELAILATVEGFRSEQMVNAIALQKEQNDAIAESTRLAKEKADEEIRIATEKKDAALRILDELLMSQTEMEVQAIHANAEAKILALQEAGMLTTEAKAAIQAEEDEALQQVRIANGQKQLAYAGEVVGQLSAISDSLFTLTNNRLNKEEKALEAKAQRELQINGFVSQATIKQQEALEKEKNVILKRQFRTKKALDLASAAISTASAVLQTIASVPYPASVPLAILAGLSGAAQIAVIASQKFEPTGGGGGGGGGAATPTLPSGGSSASASAPTPDQGAQFSSQELFGAVTEEVGGGAGTNQQRVVVLESDITGVQKQVNVAESTASFGE